MAKTFTRRQDGPDRIILAEHVNELQRSLEVLTREVFDVKEDTFGAMGDGTAPDVAAIQAALDAANAAGGGTVYFPPGTYQIASSINAQNNVEIVGQGPDATYIRVPAGSTFPAIDIDGKSNVTVRGISFIKVGGSALSGEAHAIRVRGVAADIQIEDIKGDAFISTVKVDGSASGSTNNAVYQATVGSNAATGTWMLGFIPTANTEPEWTSTIAYNASAATVQTALEGTASLAPGDVAVTGGGTPGTPYTITFQGAFAGLEIGGLLIADTISGVATDVREVTRGGPNIVRRVTLRRVTALNSPLNFGIWLSHCDDVLLDNCRARGNWLDGIKGYARVRNLQIVGGDYSQNGQGWFTNATTNAGDGIDLFAGGERTRIVGASFNDNAGSGIQIKNDDGGTYSGYGSGKLGLSRKIDLIGVECRGNHAGYGVMLINNSGSGSFSSDHISIIGGLFEENSAGLYLDNHYVSVIGAKCRRNTDQGIFIPSTAQYIDLTNCQAIANGAGAGTGNGVVISGKHITITGGIYIGADSDALKLNTDISTLTKYHTANIRVEATAQDVRIHHPLEAFNNTGRGISVIAGATDVLIHQTPHDQAIAPDTHTIFGSVGSTFTKTDPATGVDAAWIKVAGNPDAAGVWKRLGGFGVVNKTTAYTAVGHEDVITGDAGGGAFTITLPTAIGIKGIPLTIKRTSASNNVTVDGNASETIDGALTKVLGSQYAFISIVSDGANWFIIAQAGTVT